MCLSATLHAYCGWNALPSDLLKEIADKNLSFRDISAIASVCKRWQMLVSENHFGERILEHARLQIKRPQSWMKAYWQFVKTPRILALDISASMRDPYRRTEERCQDIALTKIVEICHAFIDCIELRGIDCIVFTTSPIAKKCHSIEAVMNFFTHEGPACLRLRPQGTDINVLFAYLAEMQRNDQALTSNRRWQTTILSDFDAHMQLDPLVEDHDLRMHIQCLNLGKPDAVANLQQEYHAWDKAVILNQYNIEMRTLQAAKAAKAAQLQLEKKQLYTDRIREQMAAVRKAQGSRSAKKRHRILPKPLLQPSAGIKNRKRARDSSLDRKHELPLTLTSANVDDWQSKIKKRRITLHLH